MNQGAGDVDDDETEQPQHDENEHDTPQHCRYPISNNSTAPQRGSILRAKGAFWRRSLGSLPSRRYFDCWLDYVSGALGFAAAQPVLDDLELYARRDGFDGGDKERLN